MVWRSMLFAFHRCQCRVHIHKDPKHATAILNIISHNKNQTIDPWKFNGLGYWATKNVSDFFFHAVMNEAWKWMCFYDQSTFRRFAFKRRLLLSTLSCVVHFLKIRCIKNCCCCFPPRFDLVMRQIILLIFPSIL